MSMCQIVSGILGIAGIGGMSALYSYGTKFEKQITVDEKFERIVGDNGFPKQVFIVSDTENNIYKVSKSFWYWKWYSTETWNNMKKGETYNVEGYGIRYGMLSIYPNIIEVKPVNKSNSCE